MLKYGTIKMITDKMGNKKHEEIIGKDISYDDQFIVKDYPALLIYTEKGTKYEGLCCRTSTIENIHEDSNSLTIYTRNSVYYIEKE